MNRGSWLVGCSTINELIKLMSSAVRVWYLLLLLLEVGSSVWIGSKRNTSASEVVVVVAWWSGSGVEVEKIFPHFLSRHFIHTTCYVGTTRVPGTTFMFKLVNAPSLKTKTLQSLTQTLPTGINMPT